MRAQHAPVSERVYTGHMDITPYTNIVRSLLAQDEFRLGLSLFRGLILLSAAGIILLALLHTLYYLGIRTPLYRKRAPVDGWNRRFFGATILLLTAILAISWGLQSLL